MNRSIAVITLVFLALASPALALNNRSAVASTGLDTNPCTPSSPCRSFTAAIAATATDGEIIALDSAGYGPFPVHFSMTISGAPGAHAALTVTSGDGIDINGPTSTVVTLRNLILIGSGGSYGINVFQAAETRVLNCFIRGFSDGILDSYGNLTVDHSTIVDTGFSGIFLSGAAEPVAALITNSLVENCGSYGVILFGLSTAQITSCTIGHGGVGVSANSTSGTDVAAHALVESSTVSYFDIAFQAVASGTGNTAAIYMSQSAVSFSGSGCLAGGGICKSFGNNRFVDVTSVGLLSPVGLQ